MQLSVRIDVLFHTREPPQRIRVARIQSERSPAISRQAQAAHAAPVGARTQATIAQDKPLLVGCTAHAQRPSEFQPATEDCAKDKPLHVVQVGGLT